MDGVQWLVVISTYIFEALVADMMFSSRCKRNFNKAMHFTVLMIMYIFMGMIYFFDKPSANMAMFVMVNAAVLIFMYDGTIITKAYMLISLSAIMLLTEAIGVAVVKLIFTKGSQITIVNNIEMAAVSKLFYLMAVKIYCICYTKNKGELFHNVKLQIPVLIIITAYIILVYELAYQARQAPLSKTLTLMFLVSTVMIMYSVMLILHVYEKNILQQRMLHEYEMKNIHTKHYESMLEIYDNMKSFEHDIKAHFAVIIEYAENNDGDGILRYIDKMGINVKPCWNTPITGIIPLDVVLNGQTLKCEADGINFDVKIKPLDLEFMEDSDICTLFTNLLNNAVESCNKSNGKYIFLNVGMVNGRIVVIKMKNSCDVAPVVVNGECVTSKDNKEKHGIGMKSISKVLSKYDGSMDFEYDPNEKEFKLLIQIPMDKKRYKL